MLSDVMTTPVIGSKHEVVGIVAAEWKKSEKGKKLGFTVSTVTWKPLIRKCIKNVISFN